MGRKKRRRGVLTNVKISCTTPSPVLRQVQDGLKDVTISEFADKRGPFLSTLTDRTPKSNRLKNGGSFICKSNFEKQDFSEDYDDESDEEPNDNVDEDFVVLDKVMTVAAVEKVAKLEQEEDGVQQRYVSPDVWRLIGNYILPEDVSRFGAICRDSYAVVNSPSFWLSLYRDFYSVDRGRACSKNAFEVVALPEDLKHFSDFRQREALLVGLKSKVIRLLYHRYKPFVLRLYSPQNAVPCNPHVLVGLYCLEASCEKTSEKNAFKFRLRFGRISKRTTLWQQTFGGGGGTTLPPGLPLKVKPVIKNSWEDVDDEEEDEFGSAVNPNVIFDNPQEDGCVLLAETASLSILPEVFMGLRLQSCALTVSGQSFQYRKLTLNFVPYQLRSTQTSSELIAVTINDIIRLKLVHWFHPSYRNV